MSGPRGTESGDRAAFTRRLRSRLAGGTAPNPAHPLPPAPSAVPSVRSQRHDPSDPAGSFVGNARLAGAVVHDLPGDRVPDDLVRQVVSRYDVRRAVVSAEPRARAVGEGLAALGVEVSPLSVAAAAAADLGVTSATAGLAATGTVVQHSGAAGGRTASLLPPAHLCVLPASSIVAGTAEVLRTLGGDGDLPSNLVLITGPSRSADIEQTIAMGVHGPVAVEIVVLRGG